MQDRWPTITVTTAVSPGAVAIVQAHGPGTRDLLERIAKPRDSRPWDLARLRLCDFADIDRGLAVLLRDDWAQFMPHGGPRVVEKLIEVLRNAGAVYEAQPPARQLYPEAASDLEADMLLALSRAASPAAIDLLLAQPRLWRDFRRGDEPVPGANPQAILDHSRILDRLIDPPSVVVVGRPNVGKSTLTNRMIGRSVSIVADLPGTTRDWVAGLAELSGVAVRWMDTPGIRQSDDPIEQQAIDLAQQVIASADVLIAIRDPDTDWPDPAALPRKPDVAVVNKSDIRPGSSPELRISAKTGENLDELQRRVLGVLELDNLTEAPWAFSPALKRMIGRHDWAGIRAYQSPSTSAMP